MQHFLSRLLSIKYFFWGYKRSSFAEIKRNSIVGNQSALVPQNIHLEEKVIIQNMNNIISYKGQVFIKKYSVISSGCIIVPGAHVPKVGVPFYYSTLYHIGDEEKEIVINEDCWIGAGCILLPGVNIGRGAIVGAGSVITKNIPPYAVVAGVPARIIAVKFSVTDVIEHEKMLYRENERMSEAEIEDLYNNCYKNMKAVGDSAISEDDKIKLSLIK